MGNSKTVTSTSLATLVACAILQPAPAAQMRPRFALTETRLADAFAEVREDRAPELADILTQRAQRVDLRTPTGDGLFVSLKDYFAWKEKYPPPFNVFVASPYMRALATAFEAKRRFDQLPITAICIGSGGDFEIGVSLDDIRF